ncbi:flavodoxin family protein [Pseudoflavonifractor sp. MSJ-37]|uniref:flavodoxin family protein n=1 Tax=Pseudoflavonifractor sp. MSJ-37 TaxID=2841531 RepID=UPI001C11003A|nr:NAD(P)H-dependent oxidoreductase [Pseudoflavonifractor sp. MSJ-37]MBU5435003.1 NAD(P)H-dependent oxidoreductase [Pseudoflavonifractor sp. MSJ-37]
MKSVVRSGSPRKGGSTALMAEAFAKGAEGKGHEVQIQDVAHMDIRGCMGRRWCYSHGGRCIQRDDMERVLKAMTAYLKWEDMGIVLASDMTEKGSMAQSPALAEAEALDGRS